MIWSHGNGCGSVKKFFFCSDWFLFRGADFVSSDKRINEINQF